jgi:flagellar basal-body rod modification protein FlgD
MNVSALGYSNQIISSGAREVRGELGKNDFLQLLVTQLRFQDPLKPMEDKEFVAQLAQFSALEQMQNVGLSTSLTYGMSLLNKTVYAQDLYGNEVNGLATSVRIADGKPMVKVSMPGGKQVEVEIGRIHQVDVQ